MMPAKAKSTVVAASTLTAVDTRTRSPGSRRDESAETGLELRHVAGIPDHVLLRSREAAASPGTVALAVRRSELLAREPQVEGDDVGQNAARRVK